MSILWNLFLLSMDLKWVSKQLTKPLIQCMDCQTFQSEAKSKVKAKANAPFLEPEAEPQKGQFRNGPRQNIAGKLSSLRKIWHTSWNEHYHLSRNCNQLRQARDLNKKSLCRLVFTLSKCRKPDETTSSTVVIHDHVPQSVKSNTFGHMRVPAILTQVYLPSLLPPLVDSLHSHVLCQRMKCLLFHLSNRQPRAQCPMKGRCLSPPLRAAPKRARRGGQNFGDQKARERRAIVATTKHISWLANEALRMAKENVEINHRGISDLFGQKDAIYEAIESAMEYQHRAF